MGSPAKNIRMLNKVLYVEDEPDIHEIVKLALERLGGYQVSVCDNGNDALAMVGDFQPDLILLDVMMPGMDGPTTLAELRKINEFKDCPIVFMTAKVQANEIQHLLDLGAADVISKPFDPIALSEQLQKIWDGWQLE